MTLFSSCHDSVHQASYAHAVQQVIGLYPDRIVKVSVAGLDTLSSTKWKGDLLALGIFEDSLSKSGKLRSFGSAPTCG